MDEPVRVSVAFEWTDVGEVVIDDQGKVAFPRLPRESGLYLISITEATGTTALYVGEADDLQRRFAHYRNPGPSQHTNQRINALLADTLETGGAARISMATEATLTTADGSDSALDLSAKSARLLAENAALVQASLTGHHRIENL